MLPSYRDVEGAAFGLARLHSLYGLNTDNLFDDGVISAHFNNKDVLSKPSVMKFNSKLFCRAELDHRMLSSIPRPTPNKVEMIYL
jgi:hypothetical protein